MLLLNLILFVYKFCHCELEYNKNSNEKPKLKDISNTQKLESLKEFEKSQVKSSTLFSSQEEDGCSTETKSPKSGKNLYFKQQNYSINYLVHAFESGQLGIYIWFL